jgi:hypothetical protein
MTENEELAHRFPTLFSYTGLLIKADTKYDPPFEIGASVFIQIGERIFLATAAHCMKQGVMVVDERGFDSRSKSPVTIVNRGADWELDVGFLEVQNDKHLKALGRSFCPLGQLALSDLVADDMHHIVGYPVGSWTFRGHTTEMVKCGFGTQFKEKEGEYLLFPFPNPDQWFRPMKDGFENSKFVETPEGFSGGGLWAFNRLADKELFVPKKHTKLRGIQCAWWIKRRLIKCVPIQRWLELIHEAYPDLRPDFEAKCLALADPATSSNNGSMTD